MIIIKKHPLLFLFVQNINDNSEAIKTCAHSKFLYLILWIIGFKDHILNKSKEILRIEVWKEKQVEFKIFLTLKSRKHVILTKKQIRINTFFLKTNS